MRTVEETNTKENQGATHFRQQTFSKYFRAQAFCSDKHMH